MPVNSSPGNTCDQQSRVPVSNSANPCLIGAAAPFWFLAPALGIVGTFFLLPILLAFLLSFTDFDIYSLADLRNTRLVGLENYSRLFQTELFWKALLNTFFFVLIGGPLSVGASLTVALLLHSKLTRFRGLFRTLFFAPVVTTLVAVAVVWRYLYHKEYGLLNYAISWFGIAPVDWLGDPRFSMLSIILLAVWKNFGYNMVIFMAGLQAIPESLYEAAHVDGANYWQQLRRITLPMLAPTFLFVAVTTMIGYFQLFAEPYVMTRGGPQESTYSLVYYMYEQGFRYWNLGYASAIAFVLFIFVALGTFLQMRLGREVLA